MKKIVAFILVAFMLTAVSANVFAAETNTGNGATNITVNGVFVAGNPAGEKISADISWEAMNFTYTEGDAGEWLPNEHKYAEDAQSYWESTKKNITVTNHSNVAIEARFSFNTAVTGLIGSFTETSGTANDSKLELASADEGSSLGNASNAPVATAQFGVSGEGISNNETLGTIIVTIAKK